jgi:hypothetical protein
MSGWLRLLVAGQNFFANCLTAATGGWGFGHFADGKTGDAAFMKSCFPCHEKTKGSDLVFTHYAP